MKSVDEAANTTLVQMTGLFDGFFDWLKQQYDPQSGGFYYARSSKTSGAFTPDIESTAQAINILERCQLLDTISEEMKRSWVRFFQQKQSPVNGYFYDDHPNMPKDEVMVGRAIAYSDNALRKLGSAPLYPLPVTMNAAPAYMESPSTYRKWLEGMDLRNSWRGCDRLCNSASYIFDLHAGEREKYLQTAFDFFERIQDPVTGLWGEGSLYVKISGTFKLHTFYGRFSVPMPRTSEMYNSILDCLRFEKAIDMCYIRNPIHLLSSMKIEVPAAEMAEIAAITLRNMVLLKRDDGGFSRELDHSPKAPNVAQVKKNEYYPDMPEPVHLGLGLVEGDMNAGTQAVLIHALCAELMHADWQPLKPANENLFGS
jgi:hypothetical protein